MRFRSISEDTFTKKEKSFFFVIDKLAAQIKSLLFGTRTRVVAAFKYIENTCLEPDKRLSLFIRMLAGTVHTHTYTYRNELNKYSYNVIKPIILIWRGSV